MCTVQAMGELLSDDKMTWRQLNVALARQKQQSVAYPPLAEKELMERLEEEYRALKLLQSELSAVYEAFVACDE